MFIFEHKDNKNNMLKRLFQFYFITFCWTVVAQHRHQLEVSTAGAFYWLQQKSALTNRPKVFPSIQSGLQYRFLFHPFIGAQLGVYHQYVKSTWQSAGRITYFYENQQINAQGDPQKQVELLQRISHHQWLTIPMGVYFQTRYFGVWRGFWAIGLQHVVQLYAVSEDKLRSNIESYVKDLNTFDFFRSYYLGWYTQAGMVFNLIDPLDVLFQIGYQGGFYSIFRQSNFVEPTDHWRFVPHAIDLKIGLVFHF